MFDKLFSLPLRDIINVAVVNTVNAIYFDVMPTHIAATAKGFSHPDIGQTAWIFLTSHLAFDIKSIMEAYSHNKAGGCAGFAFKYMARNSFQVDHDGFSPFVQGMFGCVNGFGYAAGHNFIENNLHDTQNKIAYEYMIPITIESSETIARFVLNSDATDFYDASIQIAIAGLKGAITPALVTTYTKISYAQAQEIANNIMHAFFDFAEYYS